jgi:arginine-tRNA-protein transferase
MLCATMGSNDDNLQLFHSAPHPCGYWPDRQARDLILDPHDLRLPTLYDMALQWGFRRSGDIVYRPRCPGCRACVPVRIPVAAFVPNRSQRRCLKRNADLQPHIVSPACTEEYLALYQRYLTSRHPGGGMDDHGAFEFMQFLISRWSESRFLELRERNTHRLLAVAVTDLTDTALSAVYTFYDPEEATRGLGTLGILQQLAWAHRSHRTWLYLGYWIAGHPKMDYKRLFRPLEYFNGRCWTPLPA